MGRFPLLSSPTKARLPLPPSALSNLASALTVRAVPVTKELKSFLFKVAAWVGVALLVLFCMNIFLGGPIDYVVPGILALGALYIGVLDRAPLPGDGGRMLKRGVAVLMLTGAAWLTIGDGAGDEGIAWQTCSDELIEAARKGGRPVMIDFTSRHCAPCLEMERKVFRSGRVLAVAKDFLPLRVDGSELSADTQALMTRFNIEAFPTIVFLGGDGKERVNLRLVGFEDALSFRQRLQQAR